MGTGFENCEVWFGKEMNWKMGLVPPLLHDPLIRNVRLLVYIEQGMNC